MKPERDDQDGGDVGYHDEPDREMVAEMRQT